jgi:2-polyprenyl-3-methyl-5-hydroxy-6-metoxy-1,4-benzoquinol methylase
MLHCIGCNKKTVEKLGSISGYSIVKCTNCDLSYVSIMPSYSELEEIYSKQKLEKWQKKYEMNLQKEYDSLSHKKNNEIKDWFEKVIIHVDRLGEGKKRILEIGSAFGAFVNYANSRGYDIYGTEASLDIVKEVQKYFPNRFVFVRENNYEVCFDKQTFDFIYMEHVLEHLLCAPSVLRQLNGLLTNSGEIMLVVPNHSSMMAKFMKLHWNAYAPPFHLFFFTPKSISYMLETAGFAIKSIESFSSYRRIGRMYTLDKYLTHFIRFSNKVFKTNIPLPKPFDTYPEGIIDHIRLLPFYIINCFAKISDSKNYGEELVVIAKKI